jgi:hypothetical protein
MSQYSSSFTFFWCRADSFWGSIFSQSICLWSSRLNTCCYIVKICLMARFKILQKVLLFLTFLILNKKRSVVWFVSVVDRFFIYSYTNVLSLVLLLQRCVIKSLRYYGYSCNWRLLCILGSLSRCHITVVFWNLAIWKKINLLRLKQFLDWGGEVTKIFHFMVAFLNVDGWQMRSNLIIERICCQMENSFSIRVGSQRRSLPTFTCCLIKLF